MRKLSLWMHSKYPNRNYHGAYQYLKGERVFVLSATLKNGKPHNVAFESYQQAKKLSWVKIS